MRRPIVWSELALQGVILVGTVIALVMLGRLGIRATEHFDPAWDSMAYHYPFISLRLGIDLPFEMSDHLQPLYDGAPPLADWVQGLIWRITGSMATTGLANYLAFLAFAIWSNRMLRAPFWLVVLISLSAPMVIIHSTVTYVDLFSNVFLAIGAATVVYMWLFPGRVSKGHLVGGLLALAAACWSKYTMTPFAGVLFLAYLPVALGSGGAMGWRSRSILIVILLGMGLASIPYLRNLVEFGNPFWPMRPPVLGSLFPSIWGMESPSRPEGLTQAPSYEAFLRSLFEIGVPTDYPNRPRWTLGQGDTAGPGFRMGGFWNIGVVVYLTAALLMLVGFCRRRGVVAAIGFLASLAMVALVPQANELRYFMFIPLLWAAIIGMLYHRLVDWKPPAAALFGVMVIVMFWYMAMENRMYLTPSSYQWSDAARATGAEAYWPELERGKDYCAVGMMPISLLLTGPTASEYHIIDRMTAEGCPEGAIRITREGIISE